MANNFQWPIPKWMATLPDIEREPALQRFYLCLASVYASEKASAADLSMRLGLKPNAVNVMKTRGRVTGETAVDLENLLGRDIFPRELFRPDLFILPE